jgi:hypothetical protein
MRSVSIRPAQIAFTRTLFFAKVPASARVSDSIPPLAVV